jgi:hypothetical protein
VDVRDGSLGAPIATGATRRYQAIDVDAATGRFYVAHLGAGPLCFTAAAGNVAAIDLDTRAVTPSGPLSNCAYAFASAGHGDQEYEALYRSFTVNAPGSNLLSPVAADTLTAGDLVSVRQQWGLGLAVDGQHRLALVPFATPVPQVIWGNPNGTVTDSNATAEIQLVDLAAGTSTVLKGFAFTGGLAGGYNRETARGIQLNPATRTGWTFGPDSRQIRQFSY